MKSREPNLSSTSPPPSSQQEDAVQHRLSHSAAWLPSSRHQGPNGTDLPRPRPGELPCSDDCQL